MERNETHKFALKAGVGEPFDTDTVTDLHRGFLRVLSDSDDLPNTFMTANEGTRESQHG